jgi:tRNA A-37 threonylcarbamoyl transferase component Bud32
MEQGKVKTDEVANFLPDELEDEYVYFKPESSRQSIELPTGYSTTIEDEYHALADMHEAYPDHVVEPYSFSEDFNGYFMEFVEGEGLDRVYQKGFQDYNPREIASSITDLGEMMKEEGIAHGDIRRENIMITEGNNPILIDAAGITEDLEARGPGKLRDRAVNWDITDINERIIDSLLEDDVEKESYYVNHPRTVV